MELTQDVSILLRVAAAMLFGGVLGVEREMGKHAAGLRTHMLIAGAAALIVGLGLWPRFGLGHGLCQHLCREGLRDFRAATRRIAWYGNAIEFSQLYCFYETRTQAWARHRQCNFRYGNCCHQCPRW